MKDFPTPHVSTPPASAPAEASKVVTHVVALGETYSSIAQKYYGSTKYINLIVKANPGKDPRKIQPGNKLNIPDGPRREASAAPKEVTPEASSERLHAPTVSAPPVASDRAYTVKPGETWHVLAQRFLGDAKRWPELYEMNVERAPRNPDGLRAGTVIELPTGVKPTTKPS
jgi:nucleoid-associated protein YgaU